MSVYCDIVQAYGPTSGGIRTYIDAKRAFLAQETDHEHVLIVPGEVDRLDVDGPLRTYWIQAGTIPKTGGYRFATRMDKLHDILRKEAPHVIEFGSPYLMPWAAFNYRRSVLKKYGLTRKERNLSMREAPRRMSGAGMELYHSERSPQGSESAECERERERKLDPTRDPQRDFDSARKLAIRNGLSAGEAADLPPIPFIVGHYHTDFPQAYVATAAHRGLRLHQARPDGKRARFAGRLVDGANRYARRVYGPCDLVMASSLRFCEKLARLGVHSVYHVPLGVDLDIFHPSRRSVALRQNLGLESADDVLLMYAGRLDSEKRPLMIVDAFERLRSRAAGAGSAGRNVHLILMGEGPQRDELEALADQVPGLTVLPYQSDKLQLAEHLASADVYVTAGAHETFALSVLEAQACGLPVTGVRAGALVDRVPRELGSLADPESSVSLAESIEEVLEGDRASMGLRAREHVVTSFGWNRTFRTLLSLTGLTPTDDRSSADCPAASAPVDSSDRDTDRQTDRDENAGSPYLRQDWNPSESGAR